MRETYESAKNIGESGGNGCAPFAQAAREVRTYCAVGAGMTPISGAFALAWFVIMGDRTKKRSGYSEHTTEKQNSHEKLV
jgi:hypothetical protein